MFVGCTGCVCNSHALLVERTSLDEGALECVDVYVLKVISIWPLCTPMIAQDRIIRMTTMLKLAVLSLNTMNMRSFFCPWFNIVLTCCAQIMIVILRFFTEQVHVYITLGGCLINSRNVLAVTKSTCYRIHSKDCPWPLPTPCREGHPDVMHLFEVCRIISDVLFVHTATC